MAITNLAYTTSDNSMGGAVLTFAFLIILFAIVATVLYIVLFSRPHPRVPARRLSYASASGGAPATPGRPAPPRPRPGCRRRPAAGPRNPPPSRPAPGGTSRPVPRVTPRAGPVG